MNQADITWDSMQDADIQRVLQIEASGQLVPWSRLAFEQSLSQGHIARVMNIRHNTAEGIVGFHVCQLVCDELHILNLGVDRAQRGYGLGHAIMDDVFSIADQRQIAQLFLEVRASNKVAISLYRKWGFEQLSLRKKYYRLPNSSEREDALVLSRRV
jgi:ribosomal-protein-alanine N-acetyltransferase